MILLRNCKLVSSQLQPWVLLLHRRRALKLIPQLVESKASSTPPTQMSNNGWVYHTRSHQSALYASSHPSPYQKDRGISVHKKHQHLAHSITAIQSSATQHRSFWLLLLTTKIAFISMSSRPRNQVAVICPCYSGSMGVGRFRVGSTPRMSVLNNGFKDRKSISLFKPSE